MAAPVHFDWAWMAGLVHVEALWDDHLVGSCLVGSEWDAD